MKAATREEVSSRDDTSTRMNVPASCCHDNLDGLFCGCWALVITASLSQCSVTLMKLSVSVVFLCLRLHNADERLTASEWDQVSYCLLLSLLSASRLYRKVGSPVLLRFDVCVCVFWYYILSSVCYYRQPCAGAPAADKHQLHQLVASHGLWPGFALKKKKTERRVLGHTTR